METFKPFQKIAKNMKGMGGKGGMDMKKLTGPGGMRQLSQMFNPQMLQQMGGTCSALHSASVRLYLIFALRRHACRYGEYSEDDETNAIEWGYSRLSGHVKRVAWLRAHYVNRQYSLVQSRFEWTPQPSYSRSICL